MKVFSLFEHSGYSDHETTRIHHVSNPFHKKFFQQTENYPIMAFHNVTHFHNAEH